VEGRRRFRSQPPLLVRLDVTAEATGVINGLFREYRATLQEDRQELLKRYQIIDMGHKVVLADTRFDDDGGTPVDDVAGRNVTRGEDERRCEPWLVITLSPR